MSRCGYEIDELDLSVRVYNVLLSAGIKTISDLKNLDDEELGKIRNLSSKGIAEIREKLKAYKDTSTNGWISVKDRLPEEKGQYIVAYHPCYWDNVQENTICVGTDSFLGKTRWAKNKFQRVTHWQPLPEPPKGE